MNDLHWLLIIILAGVAAWACYDAWKARRQLRVVSARYKQLLQDLGRR